MTFIEPFYSLDDSGSLRIGADQGSAFAKEIAGDFNPIHDPASKRFCVPGDLLFAIALTRYGLHQRMSFSFLDLVSANTPLDFPSPPAERTLEPLRVTNDRAKPVLEIEYSGKVVPDESPVEQMIRNYVAFSGHNFPHILVPLMREHNVMINPKRPLVIYQSMAFEFDRLDFDALSIELDAASLKVDGKRGTAALSFSLKSSGRSIGAGKKSLVLSGLREFDDTSVTQLVEDYNAKKRA